MIWDDIHAAILHWYVACARDLPWRRTRDPYAVLVSETMLQQTQVDRVAPKYQAWLAKFPDLATLAAADTGDVIREWQGLGYNRRAVRLQRLAQSVVREHGGALPDTRESLQMLEGIGRYTAAAVACFAYGRAEAVLDTNVRRVLGRIALGPDGPSTASPAKLWALAEAALPRQDAYNWNQALMDLGARICLERNPTCLVCPANQWCASAGRIGPAVRERRGAYGVRPQPAFEGSSRFYRGRIVERLRLLPRGETISPDALGAAIKDRYSAEDRHWLGALLGGLERDGLLVKLEDGSVRLP